LTPTEYEKLVEEIAKGIIKSAPNLEHLVIGSGRKNKITGASGYSHQIDLSLHESGRLFLIECKRWARNIGVAEVLVLAGRRNDIAERFSSESVNTNNGFYAESIIWCTEIGRAFWDLLRNCNICLKVWPTYWEVYPSWRTRVYGYIG
jgi:hypothetical protein